MYIHARLLAARSHCGAVRLSCFTSLFSGVACWGQTVDVLLCVLSTVQPKVDKRQRYVWLGSLAANSVENGSSLLLSCAVFFFFFEILTFGRSAHRLDYVHCRGVRCSTINRMFGHVFVVQMWLKRIWSHESKGCHSSQVLTGQYPRGIDIKAWICRNNCTCQIKSQSQSESTLHFHMKFGIAVAGGGIQPQ